MRFKYALKGQQLLAQGNTLGNHGSKNAPCKGKSFPISPLAPYPVILSLVPLLFCPHHLFSIFYLCIRRNKNDKTEKIWQRFNLLQISSSPSREVT